MFTVSNNGIVVINRGDTFLCPLMIGTRDGDEIVRYELQESDIVTINIVYPGTREYCDLNMDGVIENHPILQHIYSWDGEEGHIVPSLNEDGDLIVYFSHEEMNILEAGVYYYEVKLQHITDERELVDTIIPRTQFYVVE